MILALLLISSGGLACRVCDARRSLTPRRLQQPSHRMPVAAKASLIENEEIQLFCGGIAFFLAVLIDAGFEPPLEEEELSNFQGEEENVLEALAFILLRGYKRAISPNLPKNCRFVPTCSEYAALSVRDFGIVKGTVLTAWRVARCNPTGGKGYDPPTWPPPAYWAPSSSSSS